MFHALKESVKNKSNIDGELVWIDLNWWICILLKELSEETKIQLEVKSHWLSHMDEIWKHSYLIGNISQSIIGVSYSGGRQVEIVA